MKKLLKRFHYGERGFTLIELLVVVAILGALVAVAIPNVGKFIGQGKAESYQAELHDIQTAVMAMLADSSAGELDAIQTGIGDMDLVTAAGDSGALALSSYLMSLNTDGTVKSGCTYDFALDGTVAHASTP